MAANRINARQRRKAVGAAVTLGLLLTVLVAALGAGENEATAAAEEQRVGVWRFAETSDGERARPDGHSFERAATRLTNGRVLVVGGIEPDGTSKAVDVYVPGADNTGTWESRSPMRYGRQDPEVAALPKGRALVAGGGEATVRPPQEVYDPSRPADEATWMETPPAPMGKVETLIGLSDDNDQVLAIGSRNGEPTAAVFEFDSTTNSGTWTEVDASPARVYHAATRMPSGVLAVQGGTGSDKKAEVYDPTAKSWQDVTPDTLPLENRVPLLAALDGGGAVVVSNQAALRYRGPDADKKWVETGEPAMERDGKRGADAATALPDGTVLITGEGEAELFLPDQGKFVLAGHAVSRRGHTTTALADGRALVSGGLTEEPLLAPTEVYFPPSSNAQRPAPKVRDRIEPTVDVLAGGANVTIVGSGFGEAEQVRFGDTPATGFRIVDHGRIVATAPPVDAPGETAVQVETPQGSTDAPALAAFEYVRRAGVWAPAGSDGTSLELDETTDDPDSYKEVHVQATVRDNGKVLIFSTRPQDVGGRIYQYDPEKGELNRLFDVDHCGARKFVPLADGRVMVLKGECELIPKNNTAVVYDPANPTDTNGTKTSRGAPSVRSRDPAVLLDDGRVLVLVEGAASLYNPKAENDSSKVAWRTETVPDPPGGTTDYSTVTKLDDGRVLLTGGGTRGTGGSAAHDNARVFDPDAEEWSRAPDMARRRAVSPHGAARLGNGGVLVAGGTCPACGGVSNTTDALSHGEVFDPEGDGGNDVGAWNDARRLRSARGQHTLTTLADGSVLAAAGNTYNRRGEVRAPRLESAEVYRPQLDRWEPTAGLTDKRAGHAAAELTKAKGAEDTEGCGSRCGNVLVVGGGRAGAEEEQKPTRTLEVYTPRPRVDSVESARGPLAGGDQVTITGQFFAGVDSVSFGGVQSDDVEVVSQTEIVAEVPPRGSNGPVPVTVTNDVPMGGGETKALGSFPDEAPMFTYVSEAGRVDDLTGWAPAAGTVKLSWSAVDDATASPADQYVVAQSVEPIEDAGDFADAFALCGGVCDHFDPRPQAIGDPVTLTVEQLQPGTTYHYAVAPIDADGERGPISDAVSVATLGTDSGEETPSDDDGTTGDGTTGDGTAGDGTGDGGTGDGGTDDGDAGGGATDADTVQEAAEAGGGVVRLAGADRIATSVEASREAFADGEAGAVVLARADEFADGLAGVPLARVVDGPLLLTHSGELDDRVAGELQRLLAEGDDVWMLGGRAALNEQVEQRVAELGFEPQRLAGNDRFETAAVIAEFGLGAPDQVLVATGGDFADAVTAGAAAAHTQGAVVLSAGDQLPAATSDYLAQHDPAEVFAVGGPAAAAVPDAAPLAGASRFETAAAVADQFFADPSTVGVATGARFPDALSGGSHIARYGGPMLLSGPDRLHNAAEAYMAGRAATIDAGVLYGGTAALSSGVADGLAAAVTGNS